MTMKHKCYKHPAIYGSPDPGWSHDEEPCKCSCEPCLEFKRMQELPDITSDELDKIQEMLADTTGGPWYPAQLNGFGADRFILTGSSLGNAKSFKVVAELKNPGSFLGDEFIAWCRDGVPRLIKRIKQLEKDNAYVESWRKNAEDKRGAWEHQVLVRADLERKIKNLEEENKKLQEEIESLRDDGDRLDRDKD